MLAGRGGLLEPTRLVAHCLLIEAPDGLVLVDTGFGGGDIADPRRLRAPFRATIRPQLIENETALRQGVRNFINAYGDERPFIINLGNEPHGTGERVKKNVESYRIVYDEIKKIDPSIPVVATSVEPNEEYFKNGYGKWCDAYDFHIYEHYSNVRRTMREVTESEAAELFPQA